MRFSLVIEGTPVDLFSDETVQLTREIKEFTTTEAKTDFTQQFTIPSTPTNDPIFQNYFDENAVLSGWNAFLKLDAAIYIHSLPVFDGCIELTGVEFKNGLPRQYNLIFYGQGKKAIADFGEKTLPMVDWSDYNHTVDYNAVIDSWFGNLLSGKILYPIADWHIGLSYCKVPTIDNNLYSGGLDVNDLRPAILLKEMVLACFSDIGYTLSGTLLSKSNFDDLYVIPMNGAGPVQNTNNEDAKIDVSIAGYTTPLQIGNVKIIFPTVVSDPLSAYSTSTGNYTAPFTGEYTVQISAVVLAATGVTEFAVSRNNQLTIVVRVAATGSFTQSVVINANKGDEINIQQRSIGVNIFTSIAFEITQVPYGIDGSTMTMGVVMPSMKVADFINGFLKTYNGVLIPVSSTEFELHNIDDYYALGDTKEWTDYIDMTDIKHEKVPIPRSISMTHQEAEDLANVQFTSLNNRAYGSMTASPEVDFAAEQLDIESPFSLFVPSVIRETNLNGIVVRDTELQIPVVLDNDNKAVKADLWLAYFVERKTIVADTFQLNGIDQFSYPLMSTYQDYPTTTATKSVGFGVEATISGDAAAATLYVDFFQSYLSRIFSSKSRIVYFDAVLPVNEWLKLEMNDTIAVSGNYYKIQKIEYDILAERAKLTLMSYPNVELQTYTTTGNNTGWNDGQFRPDGVTTLNGDAVGRGVTNTVNNLGGGTGVTVLGQNVFNRNTVQDLKNKVAELVKGRSVFLSYNSTPVVITTPSDNSWIAVDLDTSQSLGQTYYYTHSGTTTTINAASRYKVTGEVSVVHQNSHAVAVTILVNGLVSTAYADFDKNDYSTSISEVFDLIEGSELQLAFSCTENNSVPIDVRYAKLRVEKL